MRNYQPTGRSATENSLGDVADNRVHHSGVTGTPGYDTIKSFPDESEYDNLGYKREEKEKEDDGRLTRGELVSLTALKIGKPSTVRPNIRKFLRRGQNR